MTRIARKWMAIIAVLAMIMSCCACGRPVLTGNDGADFGSEGETFTHTSTNSDGKFSFFYDVNSSLNPMTTGEPDNQMVCGLVYESVLTIDNGLKAQPGVVKKWETEDGINWILTVDDGHIFSDGNEVSAYDVAYSINCAASNRYQSKLSGWLSSAYANEDGTVTVELKRKNYQFYMLLELPVIQSETLYNSHPVGSGPYVFGEDGVTLTPNDYHKDSKNLPVETVYLQSYESVDDYISKFNDSTVDLVINDPSNSASLGFGSSISTRSFNTTNLHFVIFNMYDSCFQDHKLMHAFSRAFDRKFMVETLMQGNALEAVTPISPASPLYNKKFYDELCYDMSACRKELAEIGVDDYDSDGLAEYKLGGNSEDEDEEDDGVVLDLDLTFLVCSDSPAKVELAEKFAEEISAIGIPVSVKSLAYEDYQTALADGAFDMAYCEVKLTPDFDLTCILSPGGQANYSRSSDYNHDDNISAFLSADDSTRQAACDAMCQYVADEGTIIPIIFEKHQMITHEGVVSNITVNQENPLFCFQEWKIAK